MQACAGTWLQVLFLQKKKKLAHAWCMCSLAMCTADRTLTLPCHAMTWSQDFRSARFCFTCFYPSSHTYF
jgi:hypothetical protein